MRPEQRGSLEQFSQRQELTLNNGSLLIDGIIGVRFGVGSVERHPDQRRRMFVTAPQSYDIQDSPVLQFEEEEGEGFQVTSRVVSARATEVFYLSKDGGMTGYRLTGKVNPGGEALVISVVSASGERVNVRKVLDEEAHMEGPLGLLVSESLGNNGPTMVVDGQQYQTGEVAELVQLYQQRLGLDPDQWEKHKAILRKRVATCAEGKPLTRPMSERGIRPEDLQLLAVYSAIAFGEYAINSWTLSNGSLTTTVTPVNKSHK